MEIGLISDTHGLMRPEALRALNGVSLILHAGDVCGCDILEMLRVIAPVQAVRGNCDTDAPGRTLPIFETVPVGDTWIYLHHGHLEAGLDFGAAGIRVVVSGHTHEPLVEWRRDVLHVNPGSAGPRRGKLPVSVARLTLGPKGPAARIINLDTK